MAGTQTTTDALSAVRSLAEAGARQRGTSLQGCGLRLFDEPVGSITASDEPISPFALGRAYELLLTPATRQKSGAHLTPEAIARQLVGLLPAPNSTDTVLDPAVGGAAFLMADADRLVTSGASPANALAQLVGIDSDPGAVAVAEAALALWAIDRGVEPRPLPGLTTGDGLLDDLPTVDRVVGNPPFLNQLRVSSTNPRARRQALKERWGDLVGAYTDAAWIFLAAGVRAIEPNGVLAMIQPVSILTARHADEVRRQVSTRSALGALWLARDRVFDAAVQVCGIVLEPGVVEPRRYVGADFAPCPNLSAQPAPDEWGRAASATFGIPAVQLPRTKARQAQRQGQAGQPATVADLASATAGFRDQFYGFVPFVSECAGDDSAVPRRLVTVGMIEPLQLDWGDREFKFAKKSYRRPVIDVDALERDDPQLAEWVRARRRPKILMATQTRVVEAWVDQVGDAIPATPVISIEPQHADEATLWLLAAALTAPAVSAHLLASKFGTAMSLNSMKVAARDVMELPLPFDAGPWHRAAELLRISASPLADGSTAREFADLMNHAYAVESPGLSTWWLGRL